MDDVGADFAALQCLEVLRRIDGTGAAIAGHDGGDALVQITAVGAGVLVLERIIAVRMQVDEAGRDDQSLAVEDARLAGDAETTDGDDALAANRHVPATPAAPLPS